MSVLIEPTTAAPLIAKDSRAASRLAGALAVILILLFLLLHNPFWVRHGDSELYLSLARNIAAGEGYRFNGQPVAIAPPLWPLLLAGAMKISTSLAFLKFIPLVSLVGFLLISYHILLRWTTPLIAALCVLTAAILEPVFSLSFLFFSDSFFALLATAAMGVALRISDGKDSWGWIVLLMILCVLSVGARWAGLLFFAVVGAAVLHGEFKPQWNRRWLAFVLAGSATALTFWILRQALHVEPSELDPRYDSFVAGAYSILSATSPEDTYLNRILHFGEWIGGLFWRPAQTYRFSRPLDNLAGWMVSLMLLAVIARFAAQRRWIAVGAAVYVIVLGINWPDPISRYIVPLAPFLVYGIYQTITILCSHLFRHDGPRLFILNVFFASILGINGLLYLMNFTVMRSRYFYDVFQGGVHRQLIDAAAYLRRQPRGNDEIAISGKTVNFGRQFPITDAYRRALNFLTTRDIVSVPLELCREPDRELIQWLTDHNVRYYLYQPPIQFIEQFRPLTQDGQPVPEDSGTWRLYEIRDGRAQRVALIPIGNWPRRVPDLENEQASDKRG